MSVRPLAASLGRDRPGLCLGLAGGGHAAVQSAVEGDFAALADLVRDQRGEFIFIGTLESSASPPAIGPMFSGTAQLELKMYLVSTGEILRSGSFGVGIPGHPAKPGISETSARTEAAREVGRQGAIAARGWLNRALLR